MASAVLAESELFFIHAFSSNTTNGSLTKTIKATSASEVKMMASTKAASTTFTPLIVDAFIMVSAPADSDAREFFVSDDFSLLLLLSKVESFIHEFGYWEYALLLDEPYSRFVSLVFLILLV